MLKDRLSLVAPHHPHPYWDILTCFLYADIYTKKITYTQKNAYWMFNLSDDEGLDFFGKTLFSRWRVAFTSLLPAQVQAFQKLFLKLSLKKAYSIGLTAEFE